MSLQALLTKPQNSFFHGEISGSISRPKDIDGYYVATLRDGMFSAKIASGHHDFSQYDGKRITITLDGEGKGCFIRRKENFLGVPQISIGEKTKIQ
jgi:hypothetical protein